MGQFTNLKPTTSYAQTLFKMASEASHLEQRFGAAPQLHKPSRSKERATSYNWGHAKLKKIFSLRSTFFQLHMSPETLSQTKIWTKY